MIKRLDILQEYPAPEYKKIPMDFDLRNGIAVRMPNHLGDAMMAMPALLQLRKSLPEKYVLAVIAPAYQRKLFNCLDKVNSFISLSQPHKMWRFEEIRNLKQLNVGLGILFNNSIRDAAMMRLARIPAVFGSNRRMSKLILTHAFQYPPRPKERAAEVHQANRLLEMVYAMGAPKWDGSLPDFKLPSAADCSNSVRDICLHPKVLTVSPGAAYGAAKRWPVKYFSTVCKHWIDNNGLVAVVGTKAEKSIAEELIKSLNSSKAVDLCGNTQLDELMVLIKTSVAVLSNDSGIMHLGAALGTPGVAVFGPTDHTATGPISPKWNLVITEEKCGPCFKRVCPKNNPLCMLNITPQEVISALEDLNC